MGVERFKAGDARRCADGAEVNPPLEVFGRYCPQLFPFSAVGRRSMRAWGFEFCRRSQRWKCIESPRNWVRFFRKL